MSHASHDVIHQPEIVNVATFIISSWYMNFKSINQEISGCPNWRYPQTHKFKFHCSNSWKLPFWFVGKLNPSTASAPRWRRETGWPFPTTTTHQVFFQIDLGRGLYRIYIYMCVIRNLDLWLFSSVVSCNLTPQKNKFTRMGNTCYVICEYIQEFDKWQNPLQVNTQMSVAFHPKKSIQCSLFWRIIKYVHCCTSHWFVCSNFKVFCVCVHLNLYIYIYVYTHIHI